MTEPVVRLDTLEGGIAVVTIDQPGGRPNTLHQGALGDLENVLAQLRQRGVQGLVFRSGKPGMFIAGADLRELGTAKPDPELARRLVQRGLDVIAGYES